MSSNFQFIILNFQTIFNMTPHHKETNLSNEPVRFYKIVALSFLFLTVILLGVIIFMSTKRATITITTKPEPVEVDLTVEITKDSPTNGVLAQTVVTLSKKFNPVASKEEESTAMGTVILHNDSAINQPLVATTRLLTAEGVLFRMKKGATVPANGTIEVEVYADESGKASEIGPSKFTIPGLNEARQKVVWAENTKLMVGGVRQLGVVGSEDLKKAEGEMLVELKRAGEEKLSALYPDMKAVYVVAQSVIKADKEVGIEAEEFIMNAEATVVGAFYKTDEVKNLVKTELEKRVIGDVETLCQSNIEPAVILEEYDLSTGRAVLKITSSGLVELNAESSQLQKLIFFGKTKDEVRRYLLSLDHVNGVDIKFTPAWMRTVPHVAEHVNVVVKKVE